MGPIMRIPLLVCCLAIAPVTWADSTSSSFQVGLTVVRSPQQVAVSVARQQALVQGISQACGREGSHVAHVDDWVTDHLRRHTGPARIDCVVDESGQSVVSVSF